MEQVARAVAHIFEIHLENVEILLSYDDPRYDLVLPVPPSPSQAKPEQPARTAPEEKSDEAARHSLRNKKGHRL